MTTPMIALLVALNSGQTVDAPPQAPQSNVPPPMPAPTPPPPEPEQVVRLRMGVGLSGGEFLPGSFLDLGIVGRVGFTLGEWIDLFVDAGYQGGVHFGSSTQGSALGLGHVGVMAEITFFNFLFVAAGPLIASGNWTIVTADTNNLNVTQTDGSFAFPGIDLRAGIGFGSHEDNGRRHQFTITADVKFLFATVKSVTGAGSVQKAGDNVTGVAATLALGWDAK